MSDHSLQKRLTIGVILDNLAGDSRSSLWPGIADTIQAQSGKLLCFTGGYLHDPNDFTTRGNVVYEMIDKDALDGLIIWTSSLSSYVGQASIRKFCERYRPLPMVSIGVVLEGIPSILLDSYNGMRQALVHLITVHQRRRPVFVRGPEGHRDAQERYRAYLDVLNEYGLPVVPELISPPYKWFDPGGRQTIGALLDQHIPFDAVIGVNDAIAVEAMQVLQERGFGVPEDVSIIGFDNTPLSRVVTPLLTTVPWRMYERGRQAATLILSMLDGESVPSQVLVPTHLIVRQSCGCQDLAVIQAGSELPLTVPVAPANIGTLERDQCLAVLEQTIEEKERFPESLTQFLDAFLQELEEKPSGGFLTTLEKILRQVAALRGDITAWQMAVSVLRQQFLPILQNDRSKMVRAEDLWHQARVIIGETLRRTLAYQEWLARQQTMRLRKINHGLATMTTVPDLMNAIAEALPHIGISSCYIALYEDPAKPTEWCRLVLAFDENGRIDVEPDGQRLPSRQLAMGNAVPIAQSHPMLVAPLYFLDEQLGLILFAQQPIGYLYELLRDEISAALKSVMLMEQNARLYQQALQAEQVALSGRRSAEQADHLKSSFLSMVSHELLTPLVLLVGLSEMMLQKGKGKQLPLPEPYQSDLARIHLSAQHLGNLVRDVLDLTRSQMGLLKLAKKPLDLRETLQSVALVGEQMVRGKGLDWHVEIPNALPMVYGDASRLRQVALNLITNAVKFTEHGAIKFQVETGNEMVTVVVSDTGLGVPVEEQDAIFDEFRQSERTAVRGYGGLGIGLAICRQLVELHGGHIGVHSTGDEGGGSTFYFTLPTMREQASDKSIPPRSETVLLLTERASNSTRLFEYLTNEGFRVEALDVDETPDWLSQVLALPPGAIVLDCPPDSERGWQLIETLQDHASTQDIPVLFYSLQAENAGGMLTLGYVTKPMSATGLTQALERYGLGVETCDETKIILVVDDDPDILAMHTQIVQSTLPNCRVRQASNGRIALDIMQGDTPALVLLDLMMPELDGMGVLAAMQESERLRGIPVIILTAQALNQTEMAHLSKSVARVLHKGLFTADETMTHIRQTLARNKRVGSESRRLVRQVIAFIHEHYAEPISREEMASFIGVSARHLTRCFHQEMCLSPIAYLNRFRVKKAKQLLEAGDQNITEVAAAVGFSSSNYFTDAFRRETGMSPRDYQRRNPTVPR